MVRSATQVTPDLLAAAPNLRIVARAGTGVDNIDVAAASARGILVVNAPGANSISVAEHACALMLALARAVPAADRAMKQGKWEKKRFVGTELRGKTLGIAGFGRIGQEVAPRARAFGMRVVAHDPFIAQEVAESMGVELLSLDEVCAVADFLTLHLPSTAETRHVFNDERFARVKPGLRIINTARGDLIDEGALRRAIEQGLVAAAALDVFETEPPVDWTLAQLPQVVATPHIAASTEEAQEQVGLDTAASVRDFLCHGVVRNAVNFPSVHPDELQRLQPWVRLADNLAAIVTQMGAARIEAISLRYYGALADNRAVGVLAASAAAGVLRPILAGGVSIVNARAAARERGIEIIESRSTRPAPLHEPGFDQAAHEPGRPLGRGHGVRTEQPAAGVGARRQRRGAACRHAADYLQSGSAGRDRRSRLDSRQPRREYRELRAGPQRDGSGGCRQRGRGSERARRARGRTGGHPPGLGGPRGLAGAIVMLAKSEVPSKS